MSFIKQMLSSGMTGAASSKRGTLAWFVLLFTAVIILSLCGFTLEHELKSMLFQLVIISMGIVFGEPFIQLLSILKGQKVTQTTTTVAPPDSTVVTTETKKEPDVK